MQLATIDIIVIAVYAVFIFSLAQFVSREKDGKEKDSSDYFLASKSLPWWAIGASLIAANISAEQIVGMSGSGFALGLAIASYEWMAAITLLIVGKYFLPIFLKNRIYTMPQFLQQRYGTTIRTVMAIFWLGLYVFVNLTAVLWLGSIALTTVAGIDQTLAMFALAAFALLYQLYGGLKAVAFTDVVQVVLLVFGGLMISWITLSQIGGDAGVIGGFSRLTTEIPGHFDMILTKDNPFYKDLPGISVLIGGMWIANLAYWGFNQYIIQRALAAKSLAEAQKGIVFAAFLKLLMPVIVVLPGIAAVLLAPELTRPDEAYPTMMGLLPAGILGLVFAALIAAVVGTLASMVNSVSTIFTLDLYAKFTGRRSRAEDDADDDNGVAVAARSLPENERHLVLVGRITATVAMLLAVVVARPLLGGSDQAFQFIQEFSGFFTPGITVIFLLGLFWKKASEAGAIGAAVASVGLGFLFKSLIPDVPFMDRMGIIFLIALAIAVVLSLLIPGAAGKDRITTEGVSYQTRTSFNVASACVIAILVALYTTWW